MRKRPRPEETTPAQGFLAYLTLVALLTPVILAYVWGWP